MKRVNVKGILADPDLRRTLMVSTIQATQAREGIETTAEQADRAYYVVSEGERGTFFDLERFKGGKGEPDRRHENFCYTLQKDVGKVRFDVARRDFSAIEGSPLAYRRVGVMSPIFRSAPALDPGRAVVKQGLATSEDERWVRCHWEVNRDEIGRDLRWARFAKGGSFARFYSDVSLVILWANDGQALKRFVVEKCGSETKRVYSQEWYFKPGLTWPRRTQRGFNLRVLPEGCVFADKGPAIFPPSADDTYYILGIANSPLAEYLLQGLMSFGSWEVGVIKRLPIAQGSAKQKEDVVDLARAIYDAKASWDKGNETSTSFQTPWVLGSRWIDLRLAIPDGLNALATFENAAEAQLRCDYDDLNDKVYRLYGVPDNTRERIEETLGDRPPEVLWPQMEGKTADQKRMEHVWRLLSYAVKRVLEADDDGIVPFNAVNGEARLVERVRHELAELFPDRDVSQVEVEIVNELNQSVKGYRRCASLGAWLDNAFFEYHCGLYKSRPIFWHIASAQGTARFAFGALVHYHRFDRNRLAKLRATYLRDAIEEFRRESGLADKAGATADRLEWQARLEEAQALDLKLQAIQEGHHEGAEGGERDYRILTPWKAPNERPKGWDPDLDDGVKVNIEPLQKAGVLRIAKVV